MASLISSDNIENKQFLGTRAALSSALPDNLQISSVCLTNFNGLHAFVEAKVPQKDSFALRMLCTYI